MRKPVLLLLIALLGLAGCSSNKDEKYNNLTANEIYQMGVKSVHKKRYEQAAEDFEALESRYPFGEFADKAQLGAIYAYYLSEDYPAAIPAIDRFLRMYPRHPDVDYAYYMKGLCHFSETSGILNNYLPIERADRDTIAFKKSLQAFYVLTSRFPNSMYANDASQRMIYLRNILAENELVAARFYFKKGAYLAAANRASNVLEQFERAPVTAEALYIMVKSYRELQLSTLANDTYQVLVLNYPDSEYVKELA